MFSRAGELTGAGGVPPPPTTVLQPLCLAACLVLTAYLACTALTRPTAWLWILLVTVVVVGLERRPGGLQQLELDLAVPRTASTAQEEGFEHVKHE